MKLSKAQNPFDVQAGQVWEQKDGRGQSKFAIVQIEEALNGIFAAVEYGGGGTAFHRYVNLLRFGRYARVK